jgi:hypothetical protein
MFEYFKSYRFLIPAVVCLAVGVLGSTTSLAAPGAIRSAASKPHPPKHRSLRATGIAPCMSDPCFNYYDNKTETNSNYDGCLGSSWNLSLVVASENVFSGGMDIPGGCFGNYWDCNCNYWTLNPVPPDPPSLVLSQTCYDGGYNVQSCDPSNQSIVEVYYSFYWTATYYRAPSYSSCSNGATQQSCGIGGDNNFGNQSIGTLSTSAGWGTYDCYTEY